MATFTVTTAADFVGADGQRSLREAVTSANATPEADTIVFASALEGQTLTLSQGELQLMQDVTVDGDADNNGSRVTLSGGDASRIVNIVGNGTDATLLDLALVHGYSGSGGGIRVGGGSLSLGNSLILDSHSPDRGGAIFGIADSRLTIFNSSISNNESDSSGGGIFLDIGGLLTLDRSRIDGNSASSSSVGGGIELNESTAIIQQSVIAENFASFYGGGIAVDHGSVLINNSTIARNYSSYGGSGVHLSRGGNIDISNTTITDNIGAGIQIYNSENNDYSLTISNSIIVGNIYYNSIEQRTYLADVWGDINDSNGHNIFGSSVTGAEIGDQQNVASSLIFASLDPFTGGGLLSVDGAVPLRSSITNPALGAADRFAATTFDQLGHARAQPSGSVPDIGAVESARALSTTASANNDQLTGTSAANTISGLAGNDYIRGMAGNDRLAGGDGSDLLDGGTGNDRLDGGTGIDAALFGGSTAVVVDLSGTTDTARRGSETDTLVSVEGAIGSSAADTFRGDATGNRFMGGDGRDVYTGGAGRDLFDFNTVNDSRVGASVRDLITDLIVGQDKIDLAGIDADATRAGDQAFRWVGSTAFAANRPGEVGWFTSGTNTIIHANTDADSADELQLQLTGSIGASLAASDFHL